MADDGAEFAFHRDVEFLRRVDDLLGGGDVLGEGEAGAVDHHRLVPVLHALADFLLVIDMVAVLVDDRHVVEVEAGLLDVLLLFVEVADGLEAFGLEFDGLEPRDLDEPERAGVADGPDDRLHHGQMGDIVGGNDDRDLNRLRRL